MKYKLYHIFFHPEFCLQGRRAMQAKFRAKKKKFFKVALPSWGAIIY